MKPPSDETLARYVLGTTTPVETERVEAYLEHDADGFVQLERVRADDELVDRVRAVISASRARASSAAVGGSMGSAADEATTLMGEGVLRPRRRVVIEPGSSGDAGIVPVSDRRADVRIEGYDITAELGRGGMGVVYGALQHSTKRRVALKVMLDAPIASAAAKRRFEREVELAARMNHPNIVTILESGVASGRYYFAMQYIDGVTLDTYLRAHRPSITRRLEIFVRICRAVGYAHQCGIIHRDLKPSNIIVDEHAEPYVLDFGLAKPADTYTDDLEQSKVLSVTGQLMGTLPYMSPEQAGGRNRLIDIRTDIYSLGVMLYQALTGEFPYEVTGQLMDVLRNIQESVPRRPTTLHARLNHEIETIVLMALAKTPERRYQSAEALAEDLAAFLADAPIAAKRDSSLYVVRKLAYRHRRPISVITLILAMLAIGGWRAQRQRTRLADLRGREILADFVDAPVQAAAALRAASGRVRTRVETAADSFLQSAAGPQRVIGATSGLWVAPDAFWASVDHGPLWDHGEWLAVCRHGGSGAAPLLGGVRQVAESGSDAQRYVAWCLWGALADATVVQQERANCLAEAAPETHAGIAAAAGWAVGRPWALTPSGILADDVSGLRFVRLPGAASFCRGSPDSDPDRLADETPGAAVRIKPIFVGQTEVTWDAWQRFLAQPAGQAAYDANHRAAMKMLLDNLPADERPRAGVGYITLPAAEAYGAWLTELAATTDRPRRYRLPTEDEWEYACRGGSPRRFCYGDDAALAGYFANCNGATTSWHVVGKRMPNWFGLFDMHGGLWEWTSSVQTVNNTEVAVYRGGAFYSPAVRCRSAQRNYGSPGGTDSYRGLRLVMEFIE